ncbi:DUF397 domain-containing protein [Streptomyces sp. NPDC023998]|uniref:DUF397 domain-containing protein n=1 Tax=Streptomyces sp. NPDC023998 TaxID=3154597 RepID=UPI0033E79660
MNVEEPVQAVPESAWFKSSYSTGSGGECVEVVARPGTILSRRSRRCSTAAGTGHCCRWSPPPPFSPL